MNNPLSRNEIIKKSTKGTIVSFSSLGIQYILTFATQIILARLLMPSDFGALAFASMATMLFNNIVNTQGDKYIIQCKDKAHENLNNVFTIELILSIITILFVLIIMPRLMNFFNKGSLIVPAQFLTISFIANPFLKPRALLERELDVFKSKLPVIISQFIGGAIAIILALLGFGLWSLLWWRVSTLLIEAVIIFFIVPYKPKLSLNKALIKEILTFTWPIFVSSLLVYFYWNIDYYIVGTLLGNTELGYYWLAFQMSAHFLKAKSALNTVLFPAFSRLTKVEDRIKAFNFLSSATAAIYLFPAIVIFIFGDIVIPFIFGEEWIKAVKPFQIFFIVVLIRAIGQNSGPLLYAYGKTKQDLILSIANAILIPLFVYPLSIIDGIEGAAFGVFLSSVAISYIGFNLYVKPLTNKGFFYYFGPSLLLLIIVFFQMGILKFFDDTYLIIKLFFITIISMAAYYILFRTSLSNLYQKILAFRNGAFNS